MKHLPFNVTVIVPVYNGERYVAEALESILNQTRKPLEVLVIDDGSTDGTAGVVRSFASRVRYHYQPNRGVGSARDRGAELSRGAFLAFLDADDLWNSDKLALQEEAFEADPSLEAVFGHVRQFVSPDADEKTRKTVRYAGEALPGFHVDTLLVRRDAFHRVGHFGRLKRAGFPDWFARARETGLRYAMLPQVVACRRIHGDNMTRLERDEVQKEYFRLLKAALDRRRREGP